jgi:hypothetical protein
MTKRKLGALMIALASYGSYCLYNSLQRGWVWTEGGVKASPDQNPVLYYLSIGFWVLTCPIFLVIGLIFLFSKTDIKKDSLEKKWGHVED